MHHLSALAVALLVLVAGVVPLAAQVADPDAAECDTTLPAPNPLPAAAALSTERGDLPDPIAAMPLEVKIGQMLIAGVQDTELGDDEHEIVANLHVGNVILMGRNFDSPEQVLALTQGLQELARTSNGVGLLIATDQEGGLVQRANSYAGFTRCRTPRPSVWRSARRSCGRTGGCRAKSWPPSASTWRWRRCSTSTTTRPTR